MKNEEPNESSLSRSPARRSRFNFNYNPPTPAEPRPQNPAPVRPPPNQSGQAHLTGHKPQLYEKTGPLIFNVSTLQREPEGTRREYDFEQDRLPMALEAGEKPDEALNVRGQVRFSHIRHDILTQGRGQAEVVLECVRCLQDFVYPLEYDIEEVFRPAIDIISGKPVKFETLEEEADLKIDANHLLNLGEAIRQQILVNLPIKPVCKEDCPGLDAILEDINSRTTITKSPVDIELEPAETEVIDPRWSALTSLLKDSPAPPSPRSRRK